jgi:hypothetical protein
MTIDGRESNAIPRSQRKTPGAAAPGVAFAVA